MRPIFFVVPKFWNKQGDEFYMFIKTVIFNDVTVDIDLSVYGKSSAGAKVRKCKQMSTPQKQVFISLFEDGVNQHRIAEI